MCKLTKYVSLCYLFQREQEFTDPMTYRLHQLQLHLRIHKVCNLQEVTISRARLGELNITYLSFKVTSKIVGRWPAMYFPV